MPKRVSGKRYAEAIFELALREDQVEQWAPERQLGGRVREDGGFGPFLNQADSPVTQRIKAINAVLPQLPPPSQRPAQRGPVGPGSGRPAGSRAGGGAALLTRFFADRR